MGLNEILGALIAIVVVTVWGMARESGSSSGSRSTREYKPTCACWGAASPSMKHALSKHCPIHKPNRF